MDRDRDPRLQERRRLRGPDRVHVTGPHRRAPAPDREQGDVDRCELGHLVEEVRVAGEVDGRARARDDVAERVRLDPERQPSRVVARVRGAHGERTDLELLSLGELDDVLDGSLASDQPAGALRGDDGQVASEPLQRGEVEVVVVQVRDEHRVEASQRRRVDLPCPP